MKDKKFKKVIRAGVDWLSAIGNSAVGSALLSGVDPNMILASMAATSAGKVVTEVGSEFSKRFLSPAEEARIGSTILLAMDGIRRRLDKGDHLRGDWFSESDATTANEAKEVAERIVLTTQKDPEERKIQYVSNMWVNLCFDDRFDAAEAHSLIKNAETLTYRKMCLLHLSALLRANLANENGGIYRAAGANGEVHVLDFSSLRDEQRPRDHRYTQDEVFLLSDCLDLYRMRYITVGYMTDDIADVIPKRLGIIGMGVYAWQLMELSDTVKDIVEILHKLAK